MKREILILGDPALRQKSAEVKDFKSPEILSEMEDLKEALERFRAEKGFGRGIAAIQIGIPKRMIALNLGKGTFVIFNPEIIFRSGELFTMWDDCMSFPDLLVRVKRYKTISLRYQDEEGTPREWPNLSQAESELLQHEIDHLAGILAVDRAIEKTDLIYRMEFDKHTEFYRAKADYPVNLGAGS